MKPSPLPHAIGTVDADGFVEVQCPGCVATALMFLYTAQQRPGTRCPACGAVFVIVLPTPAA